VPRNAPLHEKLGLWGEWRLSCCSVLDRGRAPCWPPEHQAHHDWHKVRAVRLALLDLIKEKTAPAGTDAV
jgi:hypothetical protein